MNTHAAKTVRWSVMWLGKNGFIVEKDFDNDLSSALAAYVKLKDARKKWVTLRTKNVGFAPPARLTAHEEETWEIVRRRGKRFKRKVVVVTNKLIELNARGYFWCAYCHEVRMFVRAEDEVNMMCPVCETTTRDFHIRYHNPKAVTIGMRRNTIRSNNGATARRNSRKTRSKRS